MALSNKKHKKAFSLIEISVVIVIIGILISGISSGIDLYSDFRITSARSLTLASKVSRIDGLVAWWETTLEKSFDKNEAINGVKITNWYDANPLSLNKITLTQSNSANKATFKANSINSLPAISFEGGSKYITNNIFSESFTLIVVLASNSLGAGTSSSQAYLNTVIIGADYPGKANDIIPLALGDGHLKMFTGNGSETTLISNLKTKTGTPYIAFASRNFEDGTRKIMINNSNSVSDNLGGVGLFLKASSLAGIGADANDWNTNLYNGNIAEIIVYNKILNISDIDIIHKYLSKKYSIKL